MQEIFINIDDSGKLTNKEKICVYAGIVFLSKQEKDKFINQYRSIVDKIKCKYCLHRNNCTMSCPELKNNNISSKDKRWLMNYIKKYYSIGIVIRNDLVYETIKNNKASKGRFMDYTLKILIKNLIKTLIKNHIINPYKDLRIILNIDEQTTKSNGYYNLREGIFEELKYGIVNFNYSNNMSPIIFGNLDVRVTYQDSKRSFTIQASDLLAGSIRRMYLNKKDINILDLYIIMP